MPSPVLKNPSHQAEDSISLRLITSSMSIVGILAACQLAETPSWLVFLSIVGVMVGSFVSYHRRNSNNFWLKAAISLGILVVAGLFFEELLARIEASVADARMPLTNMLIALQALHCFDLPRRRDLNLSALVGLTLISSAATLSHETSFGIYLLSFLLLGSYMLHLDCVSRSKSRSAAVEPMIPIARVLKHNHQHSELRRAQVAALVLLLPFFALGFFLLIPKAEFSLLRNIRVSARLDLPFLRHKSARNSNLWHLPYSDGTIHSNPQAYFGFTQELDLNYRGKLSDQLVMRVGSARGELWRAMAFDTYNGQMWTMSKPKATISRVSLDGNSIRLSPIPTLGYSSYIPTADLTQIFYLEADQSNLVLSAAVPYLIYFPTEKLQLDHYGALRSPVGIEKDMVYTVFSRVPLFNRQKLRETPGASTLLAERLNHQLHNYLQLPPSIPNELYLLSKSTAKTGNWFQKAEQINNFLRSSYKYDLNISVTRPGEDVVLDFLFKKKRGYCEHFASAFVVLCRAQGIPARLVTGFTPGEYNPFTGLWEVRMKNAHAWAEVFVPYNGWIPFDPTPDGVPPAFSGYQKQSAMDYLVHEFAKLVESIASTPSIACCAKTLTSWFLACKLNNILFLFINFWQPAAILSSLAIVVSYLYQRLYQRHSLSQAKMTKETVSLKTAIQLQQVTATKLYQTILGDLTIFNITRFNSDTASDMLAKAEQILKTLPLAHEQGKILTRILLGELTSFLESYAQTRFSFNSNPAHHQDLELKELAALADKIHTHANELMLALTSKNISPGFK